MKNLLLKNRLRRKRHNRKKIYGTPLRPRLSIFRSCKNIYTQLIDDENDKTLASFSTLSSKSLRGRNNIAVSSEIGGEIAKIALKKGIKAAVFDRGSYAYHGKIKALAEAARKEGLTI